jgi:hypothetical protein
MRQSEHYALICRDGGTPQTARRWLFVSPNTVDDHLRSTESSHHLPATAPVDGTGGTETEPETAT